MSDDSREDRIRTRAYAIWEYEGKPSGRHDEHWGQAERDIDDEDRGSLIANEPGQMAPVEGDRKIVEREQLAGAFEGIARTKAQPRANRAA